MDHIDEKGDFMEEYKLSKIFWDIYTDIVQNLEVTETINIKPGVQKFTNFEEMEKILSIYVQKFLGYKVTYDYNLYAREIIKLFENLIVNSKSKDITQILQFSKSYSLDYFEQIYDHPYASIFINTMKTLYSNNPNSVVVSNRGLTYVIDNVERRGEEDISATIIKNIDEFEHKLVEFIEKLKSSNSFFKKPFDTIDHDEAVSYIFEWVVKNATSKDLSHVEKFIEKYGDFLIDQTFTPFDHYIPVGDLFCGRLFVKSKRANINYETPYYISFVINDGEKVVELPNIRLGIAEIEGEKTAHILAVQTSQDTDKNETYNRLMAKINASFTKSKYFRQYNPSHIVSLVLTYGILKGLGINRVKVNDYFPLRFNRLILEGKTSESELYDLQYRLVNKNILNYFKISEHFTGITINGKLEEGEGLLIDLEDSVTNSNEFFQELYNMGLETGLKMNESQKNK